MILLTLLYLSFACALPTPSEIPTNIPPSVFTRSADIFGTRSLLNIIWSCLTTLFACSWIAVHPNIPGPKDSQCAVLRRRVAIMGFVLIAPEMIIAWAARQHWAARSVAKQYRGCGWTMAHGFFLGMGGFTLHDRRGTPLRILELRELEELSEAGKIAWPSITEEEIQDRSKGDYLSKAFVLVQTGWFITQCIVRGAYGLAVTELEVATLAFAALSGVTYYLWWHKPLDVRCSVPVYLLPEADESKEVDHQCVLTTSNPPALDPLSAPHFIPRESIEDLDEKLLHSTSQSPIHESPLAVSPDPDPNLPDASTNDSIPHSNSTATPESNLNQLQRLSAFIQQQRQKHGTLLGLASVFIIYPTLQFFRALLEMLYSHTLHNSSSLRVPTFYAPNVCDVTSILVTIGVATVFGAIHCVAWSFQFPTRQERLAWRISAVSVSVSPICMFASSMVTSCALTGAALIPLIVVYLVARIVLLILPFFALRTLPASAFVDIQWTSFFPHVG